MLLALRPKFIEPYLDGMDKIYKLHKWLGITAFLVGFFTGGLQKVQNGWLAGVGWKNL